MEAVINRNMLSVRVYFLYTCMNEEGYNWKYDELPLGGDCFILSLVDLLNRLDYYHLLYCVRFENLFSKADCF